jgi:hypothetical protein
LGCLLEATPASIVTIAGLVMAGVASSYRRPEVSAAGRLERYGVPRLDRERRLAGVRALLGSVSVTS